jgi:hypothetical protein
MYVDQGGGGSAGAWQVDPDQMRAFAEAVRKVRADLNRISSEVNTMSSPNYAAMLGTSPVGQQMAEKFSDRMGSEYGLRGQLDEALKRMEEFLQSAEKTVASYEQMDADRAAEMKYS